MSKTFLFDLQNIWIRQEHIRVQSPEEIRPGETGQSQRGLSQPHHVIKPALRPADGTRLVREAAGGNLARRKVSYDVVILVPRNHFRQPGAENLEAGILVVVGAEMEDKAGFGVREGGQLAQEMGQARRLFPGSEKTRVF
jgi:hypothetical protein